VSESVSRPSFTGLAVHRDFTFRYSFLLPEGWQRLAIEDEAGTGFLYAPDPNDPVTGLSAQARDLGMAVTADDLAALEAGFLSGLRKLPRARIESREAEAIGDLITMEARHTYRAEGATRKRWVRLLYRGSTQVRLVAQGATIARFNYWLPMFYEAIRTFRFGDWWADVVGEPWRERPFEEGSIR
jgi:hypothetical protein